MRLSLVVWNIHQEIHQPYEQPAQAVINISVEKHTNKSHKGWYQASTVGYQRRDVLRFQRTIIHLCFHLFLVWFLCCYWWQDIYFSNELFCKSKILVVFFTRHTLRWVVSKTHIRGELTGFRRISKKYRYRRINMLVFTKGNNQTHNVDLELNYLVPLTFACFFNKSNTFGENVACVSVNYFFFKHVS